MASTEVSRVVPRSARRRVRTPTLLQMEMTECGAAALGIVLGHFGRHVPLAVLRQECGVSRDGSQASSIVKAGRRYGCEARGYRMSLEGLAGLALPYVVFWDFNHFLVVEGFGRDRVYLNDPALGPRTVSLAEFEEGFTGVVLHFQPGPQFTKGGTRPRTWPALVRRLRGSSAALAYCIALALLLVLPGLALPAFSRAFVDDVLVRRLHGWVGPLLLGMLLTTVLRAGLAALELRHLRALRAKLAAVMSSKFLWHVLHLRVSFYAQRFAGEISQRVQLNESVAEVLSGQLARNAIDLLMILFYGAVMVQLDLTLALIAIGAGAANLVALRWIGRRRVDANLRLTLHDGRLAGASIAGLQAIETVKASGLESDFFARWAGHLAKATAARQELEVANAGLAALPGLLGSLTTAAVLVAGGLRVMRGELSVGMLVAFQTLAESFLQPVRGLVGLGATIQQLQGDLTRLDDVLREEPDPSTVEPPGPAGGSAALGGRVELREVTFGYNRLGPPLIDRLSLRLEPGMRVALVGGSGSGKSTVARLVSGLYEPWEGEILFDGQPWRALPRARRSSGLAMVEQEISLFEGTVRENLTLWDASVAEEELVRACRDAQIHDVVAALPGGYDATLAEGGSNLSGGQRQRLEIARALAGNPSILILDEATSALDAETESLVDQALRRRGCTCIIVAHRLSTIRDCDEILVLREGKVIERGTHAQLMAAAGAYAELIATEGEVLSAA